MFTTHQSKDDVIVTSLFIWSWYFLPHKIGLIPKYLCKKFGSHSFKDKRGAPRLARERKAQGLGPVYRTVPLRSVSESGTEKGCVHTGTEKNQAVRSKTGPETGRYGKVNQKLERYGIVPFRSRLNRRTGPVQVHFPDLFGFCGWHHAGFYDHI